MKCCKTCKWIDAGKDTLGRRHISKLKVYTCLYAINPTPNSLSRIIKRMMPSSVGCRKKVWWDDGQQCPCWEEHKK